MCAGDGAVVDLRSLVEIPEVTYNSKSRPYYRKKPAPDDAIDPAWLRSLRERHGMNPVEFAWRYGFHPCQIRAWENGYSRPCRQSRILLRVIAVQPELLADIVAEGRR